MHYVYLLESEPEPDRRYVGLTIELRQRLQDHNAGKSSHTAKLPALENRYLRRIFESFES